LVAALFQDATANALAVGANRAPGADMIIPVHFKHYMTAGTTSETTFKVRVGNASGTTTFNGIGSGPATEFFGDTMRSYIIIREYLP
jgi:hypothetical protein